MHDIFEDRKVVLALVGVVLSSSVNECFTKQDLGANAKGEVEPRHRVAVDGFRDDLACGEEDGLDGLSDDRDLDDVSAAYEAQFFVSLTH